MMTMFTWIFIVDKIMSRGETYIFSKKWSKNVDARNRNKVWNIYLSFWWLCRKKSHITKEQTESPSSYITTSVRLASTHFSSDFGFTTKLCKCYKHTLTNVFLGGLLPTNQTRHRPYISIHVGWHCDEPRRKKKETEVNLESS